MFKSVEVVPINMIPPKLNIVYCHVVYNLKQNDDKYLKLTARLAPHENEDDLKELLSKDCTKCPPTGIRILQSILFSTRMEGTSCENSVS